MGAKRLPAGASRPNKFPGICDGCCRRVEAGKGVWEAIYHDVSRIRCLACVKAKRSNGPPELPGDLHNTIGELLSDDPSQFVVFQPETDQWVFAVPFDVLAAMFAMQGSRPNA